MLTAVSAMREVLASIRQAGTPVDALASMPGFGEFLDFIGLPEIHQIDHRFAAVAEQEGRDG